MLYYIYLYVHTYEINKYYLKMFVCRATAITVTERTSALSGEKTFYTFINSVISVISTETVYFHKKTRYDFIFIKENIYRS